MQQIQPDSEETTKNKSKHAQLGIHNAYINIHHAYTIILIITKHFHSKIICTEII